jgi:hypothetical protein
MRFGPHILSSLKRSYQDYVVDAAELSTSVSIQTALRAEV